MSITTVSHDTLIRGEIWDAQIKEALKDELGSTGYVQWVDFPDGHALTIPSVGEATIVDYVEDTPVSYQSLDTGEFQLTTFNYKSSGLYITKKMRQDSFYAARLEASFVPKQTRAFQEVLESDILGLAAAGASGGQTAAATNTINGAYHRWTTKGSSGVIEIKDFAKVNHSLKKANVGGQFIGIVDPSFEYQLSTITNLTSLDANPRWEGIVNDGMMSGMKFVRNVYGIDLYTSNYLPAAGAAQTGAETIDSTAIASGGVCNVFFSTSVESPFMGAWRQQPEVESEYNKDYQREEYILTGRYSLKVYRPENLVVVINKSDQIA
jgi:hypothetical protein